MAVAKISDSQIGQYLKIVSKGAVYNNLSEDSEIWNMVKQKKAGPAEGRELRFSLREGYGSGAAGFLPLDGGGYPDEHKSQLKEGIKVYKDYAVTVEVERTLVAKAISDFSKYADPLAEELRIKTIALSRLLSYRTFASGTGVLGTILSAAVSNGRLVVTLSSVSAVEGFIGWIQGDDILALFAKDGTKRAPTVVSGTYDRSRVYEVRRDANEVELVAVNDQKQDLVFDTIGDIAADDVIYRHQQEKNGNISDISAIANTVDRNSLSEGWCGLDDLTARDGRLVNGIPMNGVFGGTRKDLGGVAIDSQHVQRIMSQLMIRSGQGRYKYSKPLLAWEALDALIESRETDRRFQSIQDNKKGVAELGYVHGKNTLIFTPDEFCPLQRMYFLPDADVCQFHGDDFKFVNPNGEGQTFFLKPNGSGHDRVTRAYMEGSGSFHSVHSAAIGVLENFSV